MYRTTKHGTHIIQGTLDLQADEWIEYSGGALELEDGGIIIQDFSSNLRLSTSELVEICREHIQVRLEREEGHS